MIPPASGPLAFISDVHGNLAALDAVLAELGREDVGQLFAAGDLLFGGDEPLEVWRRLSQLGARMTMGLTDRALVEVAPSSLAPTSDEETARAKRFAATRNALGDLVIEQLRRLPETLRVPMIDGREIVMVHGSPLDPTEEITHDMSDEEVLSLVGDDPADVVICGMSHVPFERRLDELVVVNVGSVGAAPEGQVAHYTILTPRMEGPEIRQHWVEL
jgi:predicted phosphodiesterase